MEELTNYVEGTLTELGSYMLPGYAFPALLIIGLFFLSAGARICRGVVAGLCFLAGAAAGYHFANENIAIALACGVGAAVAGLIVQYVVVVLLAGSAAAGAATLAAFLMNQESMAWIFAIGGFLVGALLAVRLYKILLIFATAALGAACVTACGLILLEEALRPEMTEYVELGTICLDLYKFSIGFYGLLAAGIAIQGAAFAYRKAARPAAG